MNLYQIYELAMFFLSLNVVVARFVNGQCTYIGNFYNKLILYLSALTICALNLSS